MIEVTYNKRSLFYNVTNILCKFNITNWFDWQWKSPHVVHTCFLIYLRHFVPHTYSICFGLQIWESYIVISGNALFSMMIRSLMLGFSKNGKI